MVEETTEEAPAEAAEPAEPAVESFDDLLAQAEAEFPASEAAPKEEPKEKPAEAKEKEEEKPKEPKRIQPPKADPKKARNQEERFKQSQIAKRQEARERLAKAEQREQEIARRESQIQQMERLTRTNALRVKEMWDKGDVDEALKAAGLPEIQDLNAAYVKARGANVSHTDPATRAKLAELEAFKEKQEQEAKQRQEFITQQQARAREEQEVQTLLSDVKDLGFEAGDEIVQLPGFGKMLMGAVGEEDPENIDLEKVVEQTALQYLPLAERLLKVFPHLRELAAPDSVTKTEAQRAAQESRGMTAGIPQSQSTGEVVPPVQIKGTRATDAELEALIKESERLYSNA